MIKVYNSKCDTVVIQNMILSRYPGRESENQIIVLFHGSTGTEEGWIIYKGIKKMES